MSSSPRDVIESTSDLVPTPAPGAASPVAATSTDLRVNDDGQGQTYLTFTLGTEEYGFEILTVREIIGVVDITPLPQSPDYVRGVINLRGRIIPVMELRTRFGLPTVPYNEETCIIVLEVLNGDDEDAFRMGVVVDTVNEVLDIPSTSMEAAPRFGHSLETHFITGMGKARDRVITLLNVRIVLAGERQDLTPEVEDLTDAA